MLEFWSRVECVVVVCLFVFQNILLWIILICIEFIVGSALCFSFSFLSFFFLTMRNMRSSLPESENESEFAQSCLSLCNLMDYVVHGILQARILEGVGFPFSKNLAKKGIKPRSPTLQADSLPVELQAKPLSL